MTFASSTALATASAVIALVAAMPSAHAVIVNGGFESGTFAGWTRTGDTFFDGVGPSAARSGAFGAYFGPLTIGGIEQSFATVAGATYAVNFSLALPDGIRPNRFAWSWDGVAQGSGLSNAGAFPYTEFSSLVVASGASSTLAFDFRHPQAYWFLDNVSVVAVPEMPINVMLGAGLLVTAALARRGAGRRRVH